MAGDGRGPDAAEQQMSGEEAARFAVRLALFFGALFLIYGVHLPYLPVWLDFRGMTPGEIGLVTATPFFLRLVVTPAVALYADQWGAHRAIVITLAWTAVAASLLLTLAAGFHAIFAAAVVFALASSTMMPLIETVAVAGVRRGGLDYGRMRLWGSLTFILATFGGGAVLQSYGPAAGVWLMATGALATAVAAHLLPRPADPSPAAVGGPSRLPKLDDAVRLLRAPVFLAFLVAVGAVQGAHATFYTFGALHWRSQGLSSAMIGALWTIGVAAEIALFAYSGFVMARIWATSLLILGGAAAVLRWSLMGLDPPLALLVPLQLLHGATYGAAHLGAIHFISRAVPDQAAGTAQAIYATVAAGVAMGAATLAAGSLYARYGGGSYWGMAAIAAVGLLAALYVRRSWSGAALWPAGDSGGRARPAEETGPPG